MNQEENVKRIEEEKNERLEKAISNRNREIAEGLGDSEFKDYLSKIPDSFIFEELVRRNNIKNRTIMTIKDAFKLMEEEL